MDKEKNPIAEKDENGAFLYMDIIPMTYILPSEFNILVEDFRKYPGVSWIFKPTAGA